MQLLIRIQRAIGKRWFARQPTHKLVAMIGDQSDARNLGILIDALKERLAHQDGSLDHVDWSSAELKGALLSSCRMTHAKLPQALLRGAYFGYSDMRRSDFSLADLRESHFREARLNHAIFDRADLREANFARAVLVGCSFIAADLSSANFWRADLRGADLTEALIINCNMADALVDETTRLPDGEPCGSDICWDRFTLAEMSSRD